MTLTDFLLARIADDEAVARDAAPGDWYPVFLGMAVSRTKDDQKYVIDSPGRLVVRNVGFHDDKHAEANADHVANWNPARVLAECEAKRRVVALAGMVDDPEGLVDRLVFPSVRAAFGAVLTTLAVPYANHPDYRDEWSD